MVVITTTIAPDNETRDVPRRDREACDDRGSGVAHAALAGPVLAAVGPNAVIRREHREQVLV